MLNLYQKRNTNYIYTIKAYRQNINTYIHACKHKKVKQKGRNYSTFSIKIWIIFL